MGAHLSLDARTWVYSTCVSINAKARNLHSSLSASGTPRSQPRVKGAGVAAKLGIKAHAHMLRHATGFKLANDGIDTRSLQAYLGHRNIQNTTRYTALAPDRFKGFWQD